MREHQITINLRPEQFQEIQRLSRAAGARSIGLFARERLLTALGLSGVAGSKPSQGPDHNLNSATSDIRRLHRELQTFIAESLSNKDHGYGAIAVQPHTDSGALLSVSGQQVPIPVADVHESAAAPQDIAHSIIEEPSQTVDEMEELAERAFAISPRLGAIEELSDDETPFSDPLDELLGDIMSGERAQVQEEFDSAAWPESAVSLAGSNEYRYESAAENEPDLTEYDLIDTDSREAELETDESAGSVDASAGSVDESAGSVDASAGSVDESAGSVDESAGSVDESAGSVDESAGSVDESAGSVNESPGSADKSSGSANESASPIEDKVISSGEAKDQAAAAEEPPSDPPFPPTNFPPPISGGPPPRKRRT